MLRALRGAVATREMRLVEAAWAFCSLGSWAFMIALAIYAYGEGGAAAVGLAAFTRMVPAGLAAPFAGLLADRHSRRDVLLAITAARVLLLGGVTAAVAADLGLAPVLALAALFTIVTTAHKPAQAALLPLLARTPAQLAAANAVWTGIDSGGFLAGALLGGVLVAATSVEAAFGATAAAFALATLFIAAIPRDPVPPHREREAGATAAGEALLGLRTVTADRRLRLLVGVLSISTVVEGAIDVLLVIVALELLQTGPAGVGWLNAAWGVGGIAGGAAALALLGNGRLAAGLGLGGVLAGAPLVVVGIAPYTEVALAMLVILGVGYSLIEIAGQTLLQRLCSDESLARAFGVVESSYQLTTGVGSILAPVLIAALGAEGALVALGVCLPLTVVLRWSALQRFEAGVEVPEREYATLRTLPLFAALPIATLENLACAAIRVTAGAGQMVITEGDIGDRFYVLADGACEVRKGGDPCGSIAPGGCFGEIALLRDVPRTATVTAVGEATLFALEREDFLFAVTGNPRCLTAAHTVADGHLARDAARTSPAGVS